MNLEEYDKDKPVVLVCAGPSARYVEGSDNYYTAGVNVTPNLIEKTDFWLLNDACYLSDLRSETYDSITNLVIPEFPHTVNGTNYEPQINYNYATLARMHVPSWINLFPFNIQSAARFNLPYNKKYPFFNVKSSSEVAFKWLAHQGFRKFITLGHDPDGGYHPEQHSRPTAAGGRKIVSEPIDNDRYKEVHSRMRAVISDLVEEDPKTSWVRIIIPEGAKFNDSVFKEIENATCDSTGYGELVL